MRKIYLLLFLVFAALVSCKKQSFLDDKTNTILDEKAVFSDSARTMAFLTRIYEDMPFNFYKTRWENGTTEQATEDAEYTLANPARRTVALYLGAYSAESFIHADAWDLPWANIRRVNLLLKNLPGTPLSAAMQSRIKGEAKFMRAYFYTYLVINFGGVPLIGNALYDKDASINLPRGTFDDCVTYISKEFDEAAALLPVPNAAYPAGYQDIDFGRVTKGSAMAMKARLLLHAASPLFNGGAITGATEDQKKVAGYPTYDVTRWQKAADAALAVINSGYYSLNVENNVKPGFGFYNVFLKRYPNPEYILFFNRPPNRDMESNYLPSSRSGSFNTRPTQNLVECFPMNNGKAITDPASGYDPANPYANRDPRFNYTIIYNGSRYQRANTGQDTVFTYLATASATNIANSSGDGYVPSGAAPNYTGYYCRKMCDSTIANNSSGQTNRGWPLLRYAEILLSYAEAMNEVGQIQAAYDKIIEIRSRAGIEPGGDGLYGLKAGMTQTEMREIIRNERHIELVFEGDVHWNDICRWKTGEVVNNGRLRGMMITRSPLDKKYTYTEVLGVANHTMTAKQYLFPIPALEIRKSPLMIQNPGW